MGRFWPDALYSLRSMTRKIDSCQRTRYSRDVFLDADGAVEGGPNQIQLTNRQQQSIMKIAIVLLLGLSALCATNPASAQSQPNGPATSDPGWPRQKTTDQGSLVYYQPQVDDWKDFKQLDFRMAFSLTPKGQKEVVGVLSVQAQTAVDVDQHDVVLTDFKITQVYLPSVDPEKTGPLEAACPEFLAVGLPRCHVIGPAGCRCEQIENHSHG